MESRMQTLESMFVFSEDSREVYCTKKWNFPWRISSVNVAKSVVSFGFGHIYWGNP